MRGVRIETEHIDFVEVRKEIPIIGETEVTEICVSESRELCREREKQNKTNKGKPKLNKTPEICLRVLSFWLNTNLCFHNAKLCEVRKRTNAGKFK